MNRAVIYNRYHETEKEESINLDGKKVLDYVEAKGLTLMATIYDNDKSANDYTRPGFVRLLKEAAAGSFDVLIVPRVYKLTRSIDDLRFIVEWMNKRKITVYFCDLEIEAGPLGFDVAFGGMIESIENELINGNPEDEVFANKEELKDYLGIYEVLDKKFVN